MNFKWNGKLLARQSIIGALYVVLTLLGWGVSYGPVQFRFAELMTWLAFFDPKNIIGLSLGCLVSNIWSPYGIIDMVVGTLGTLLAGLAMAKTSSKWIASICPALPAFLYSGQALFLGEITREIYLPVTLQIMLSQFIIVAVVGLPLMGILGKNQEFMELVQDRDMRPSKEDWIK